MQEVNQRDIALVSVIDILEDGQYSHTYINNVLEKYAYLEKSKRSFVNRIITGTVERKIELDYIINTYSKTKTGKMKPLIRNILRLGTYEIYYMDYVPDAASCNEYVKLCKKHGFTGLSGFVNGVLRSVIRGKGQLEINEAAIKYSMPEYVYSVLERDYGSQAAASISASYLEVAPLTIRVDISKISVENMISLLQNQDTDTENTQNRINIEQDSRIPYCLYLTGIDNVRKLKGYDEGYFYVQDYSSMLVGYEAFKEVDGQGESFKVADGQSELSKVVDGQSENFKVVDVCAAPGGKALHLASLLAAANSSVEARDLTDINSSVEARDLTDLKVDLIRKNIARSKLTNITAKKWDATVFDASLKNQCDILICDLPCSGLGIIRKKPDIKYKASKEETDSLVALQTSILNTVYAYVKAGGILMYSTCTLNKDENERQVEAFLKKHEEFELISEETVLPDDKNHTHDGFFLAKLVRIK